MKRPQKSKQVAISGTKACHLTREEEHELVTAAVRKAKDGEKVVISRSGGCIDIRTSRREQLQSPMGGSGAQGAPAAADPLRASEPNMPVLLGGTDPIKEG